MIIFFLSVFFICLELKSQFGIYKINNAVINFSFEMKSAGKGYEI